jgi:hypothetical protein
MLFSSLKSFRFNEALPRLLADVLLLGASTFLASSLYLVGWIVAGARQSPAAADSGLAGGNLFPHVFILALVGVLVFTL